MVKRRGDGFVPTDEATEDERKKIEAEMMQVGYDLESLRTFMAMNLVDRENFRLRVPFDDETARDLIVKFMNRNWVELRQDGEYYLTGWGLQRAMSPSDLSNIENYYNRGN